jgi:tetratricopeptide (TPR) repeat protein
MHRLILTVALVFSTGVPASANDEQDCFHHKDPQLRIKGCSQMIQRDPADAAAYHNRAVAHGLLGDLDHAIADYTKTVEIRPDNVGAYESRGRAYASKGDYTNAIADAMKASELQPSTATRTSAATFTGPNPEPASPKISKKAAAPSKSSKTAADTYKPSQSVVVAPTNDAMRVFGSAL